MDITVALDLVFSFIGIGIFLFLTWMVYVWLIK